MNKNLIPFKSTLLKNKLASIMDALQRARDEAAPQTKEALLREAIKMVAVFYKQLNSIGFVPTKIFSGTYPDHLQYNDQFNHILSDLEVLFAELENVESIVLEQFNLATTATTKINGQLKRVASKIADYSLYARLPLKDKLYFSDSFTDYSKLDVDSALINSKQAEINQVEGIVTLPINRGASAVIEVNQRPVINPASNGRSGNNEDVTVISTNDNATNILDGNPDSWFEYERVEFTDTQAPLVLDLTLNLSEAEIINHIRVNPNNFGTKSNVKILSIDTSMDGFIFTSIKDDIPISGYLVQDEDNVFSLAPATSKFAGQGIFTFTPRKAKYVRLVLEQNNPYVIQTVRGQQYRYAIGLRDVELHRLAYDGKGEVVTKSFIVTDDITKVGLQTTQSPLQSSELADVTHQVSFDDGVSWHSLRSRSDQGVLNAENETPEILTLNIDTVPGAIKTETPARSLRYRAVLERKDGGFTEGSASFAQSIADITEQRNAPRAEPWAMSLSQSPVLGTIKLIDPNFGVRGNERNRYLLGRGNDGPQTFALPWQFGVKDVSKIYNTDDERWELVKNLFPFDVYVGGKKWTKVNNFAGADWDDQVYIVYLDIDISVGRPVLFIRFGDETNGEAPANDARIEVVFTPERLSIVSTDTLTAKLDFGASRDKTGARIVRRGEIFLTSHQLQKAARVHPLPFSNIIVDDEHPFALSGTAFDSAKEKVFVNGMDNLNGGELDESGSWSLDKARGVVYSYDQTASDTVSTAQFYYRADAELASTDWDFADTDAFADWVRIKPEAWVTKTRTFSIPTGSSLIGLPDRCVVKGSLKFTIPEATEGTSADSFIREIDFSGLDTAPELSSVVKTEEVIPALDPGSGDISTFVLQGPISANTNLLVAFTDLTVFATALGSAAAVASGSLGDYHVNRTVGVDYGKVTVFTGASGVASPGSVSYYMNSTSQLMVGAYSVDYVDGVIHTQVPTPANCVVAYEYSDYYMHYNIARLVDEQDWTLDLTNKRIALKPREIARRAALAQSNASTQGTYQISYKYIATVRQDIAELAPYFSPVLKDFALEIITKGNF